MHVHKALSDLQFRTGPQHYFFPINTFTLGNKFRVIHKQVFLKFAPLMEFL